MTNKPTKDLTPSARKVAATGAGAATPRRRVPGSAPPRNLHGHVVHELGQRIVGGELHPGELLPREEALADQMRVSRTALREAMKVLSAKGLVESRPKVGTRVRDPRFWHQLDADVLAWRCALMPTEDFVRKLVEMREVIEPAAAAAAAVRCSVEQLERLDAAYAAMAAAKDLDAWTQADLAFHEAVLTATNNELMASLFSVIETALGTFFVLSARTARDFKYSLPHHQKVLEAIRRRQPDAARRAMLRMVDDSRANMDKRRRGAKV
jgi:DNA-binding FadR family transcriptional regulator